MNDKTIFALVCIGVISVSQWIAWYLGVNGQVFAFTSLIIGLISGSILGFSFQKVKNKVP